MILWLFLAILTAVVVGAILVPLLRDDGQSSADDVNSADLAVYRDQLAEIEREREHDLINETAAAAARAELARRIFSHTEAQANRDGPDAARLPPGDKTVLKPGGISQAPLIYGLAALIPLVSAALYIAVGSPNLPGRPYVASATENSTRNEIEPLIAQVEARLRDKPQDGRGWDVVAPVYFRIERFEDARIAYQQAVALLGPTKSRLNGLALSAVRASGGVMTPQARQAFQKVLVLDPENINARLWLVRAKEQDGDIPGAIKGYEDMLAGAPKTAPWQPVVKQRIAALRESLKGAGVRDRASGPRPNTGPAPNQPAAATIPGMNEKQRAKFIESMVAGLASRLAKDGSNFKDWVKLVRAYAVLGRTKDAKKALADARMRFATDNKKAGELDALESEYNLGS